MNGALLAPPAPQPVRCQWCHRQMTLTGASTTNTVARCWVCDSPYSAPNRRPHPLLRGTT